ncbi:urate oxidase/2-oxo-4-hydroxy-4-carboxy-5-ureidoimidazoline decarboxylase [Scopulibacillus darangshiensis]|uniref:Urate oxidase/2-oxo-4-hydroxy-4-carboxy-5-ureidoimidazoline decarboxylase n=1 Tax=Scopulibacillus darangshiensis TaxID=442528 RepID=A0A4R2NK72_9BACL|nr:urate oxidase [Scopulibacillus darangshiensis]TCP21655.1 urate oxidase/2-oxo-4-hydroxy-4-carboxy-5-ureidoimidazoline decarboxylase [Scopulibacillus darangshiensis]
MPHFTLKEINQMDQETFTETLGFIFEHSPWVARQAWMSRPFSSLSGIHSRMAEMVERASIGKKLALIRAHPDLATRVKVTEASRQEQAGAGFDKLSEEEYEEFLSLNQAYTKKFSFPFIKAVRGHNKDSIKRAMIERLKNNKQAELDLAIQEIYKIASFRLDNLIYSQEEKLMGTENRTMYYGKADVYVFRTFAKPLTGVKHIPESEFSERDNVIFGLNAKVALRGKKFLTSFTEGDNSLVVATDSMKNFIQRHAAEYEGATMEGLLAFISERFLEKYDHIESVEMSADEIPFEPIRVPADSGFEQSRLVYNSSRNQYATATVRVDRKANGFEVVEQASGLKDLHLIKVRGSSFYGYIKDEYTTLREETDRPLFIYLDINWKYSNPLDATGANPGNYVAAEQIRDISRTLFHQMDSRSIQQLIYHIGCRALERFPQLQEVSFESNNRTWITIVEDIAESEGKVYTEPLPPYGFQGFSVTRADIEKEGYVSTAEGRESKV